MAYYACIILCIMRVSSIPLQSGVVFHCGPASHNLSLLMPHGALWGDPGGGPWGPCGFQVSTNGKIWAVLWSRAVQRHSRAQFALVCTRSGTHDFQSSMISSAHRFCSVWPWCIFQAGFHRPLVWDPRRGRRIRAGKLYARNVISQISRKKKSSS